MEKVIDDLLQIIFLNFYVFRGGHVFLNNIPVVIRMQKDNHVWLSLKETRVVPLTSYVNASKPLNAFNFHFFIFFFKDAGIDES